MILALITVRTVNLSEIALAFISDATPNSRYKRLNRFFAGFKVDILVIGRWLFKLFFPADKPVYLIIDRTNWYWGKEKINIFMLSIAYEGIAIPVYWILLDKAGSSSAQEQIQLIENFLKGFDNVKIEGLLADREFGNGEFFSWLNKQKIPFYIRIKEDSIVRVKNKKLFSAERLFRHVNPNNHEIYGLMCEVFGAKVYLAASRSERGELMIIVTNAKVKQAIAIYLRRWEIENLFQSLKGRGFRFEETRMAIHERIEKLVAVLAIAFSFAHKTGEWHAEKRPIRMSKQKDGTYRPRNSFFRYGLDFIRNLLLGPYEKNETFKCLLEYFSSAPIVQEVSL